MYDHKKKYFNFLINDNEIYLGFIKIKLQNYNVTENVFFNLKFQYI